MRRRGATPREIGPQAAARDCCWHQSFRIRSAHPLSDDQMSRLETSLRDVAGAKVTLETSVDPSLLGGLVVQLGSRMYDSSLRTKLQRLQHAMKGVQ